MTDLFELARIKSVEMDRSNRMDSELLETAIKNKFTGVTIPEELGGMGKGYRELSEILIKIARVNPSFSLTLAVHHMVVDCVKRFGRQEWLRDLTKYVSSFAATEPLAGSDVSSIRMNAEIKNGFFVLNGSKILITNAEFAEVFIVLAKFEDKPTAFYLRRSEGIEIRRINVGGMRGSGISYVKFRGVEVPKENVIGEVGKGLKVILSTISRNRFLFSSIGLGIAENCLEFIKRYSKSRRVFGKRIIDFQGIRWLISECVADVEALRALINITSDLIDKGEDVTKMGAICRLISSKTVKKVVDTSMQVLGGRSVVRGRIERAYRDAKALDFCGGSTEIMKEILSRFI